MVIYGNINLANINHYCNSFIVPNNNLFFLKRKKDKINQRSSEAIERMQIREYGRKINNITREKIKLVNCLNLYSLIGFNHVHDD